MIESAEIKMTKIAQRESPTKFNFTKLKGDKMRVQYFVALTRIENISMVMNPSMTINLSASCDFEVSTTLRSSPSYLSFRTERVSVKIPARQVREPTTCIRLSLSL